jgi:cytochrome bd-type quinol oxidase subunit 1
MSPTRKSVLMILGLTSALLLVGQLVLGQLLLSGQVKLKTAHQHSGYTAAAVTLIYIVAFTISWRFSLGPRSRLSRPILYIGSFLAAALVLAQLVMGQLILSGADLIKAHQHSGYATVTICLIYVAGTLAALAGSRRGEDSRQ